MTNMRYDLVIWVSKDLPRLLWLPHSFMIDTFVTGLAQTRHWAIIGGVNF